MKKTLSLIVLSSLLIVLYACSIIFPPRSNKLIRVDFYDTVYETVSNRTVSIYFHDLEEVPYMSFEEFIGLLPAYLSLQIESIDIDDENGFTLTYQDVESETLFSLTYDHISKEIVLNHIEFLFFLDGDLMYPDYYYLTSLYEANTFNYSQSVTFDLGSYNLEGVIYQQKFYLPLSVLNLFFSGFQTNLYFNGLSLYATDGELGAVDFPSRYVAQDIPFDLRVHIMDYLAFYFDYFYGLNFDLEPYYYKDLFEPLKDELDGDTFDFYQYIDFLIKDFDDMHMYVGFEGYYGDSYDFDDAGYTYTGRTELDRVRTETFTDYCENNVSTKLNSQISLIVVNGFDTYTAEIFAYEKDLYVGDQTTDVVIDFTCNPGGLMYAMMDMLPYVIEGQIPITLKHHGLGNMHRYYFDSDIKALDQNIYIKTSAMTYSAANIFTLYAKTYGNAIVIGEKSGGGSSHVDLLFAPAGMLIYVPFMFHFSTPNGVNVEYGIDVDYTFTSQDVYDLIDLIESIE